MNLTGLEIRVVLFAWLPLLAYVLPQPHQVELPAKAVEGVWSTLAGDEKPALTH